jgi:hypothetical protein
MSEGVEADDVVAVISEHRRCDIGIAGQRTKRAKKEEQRVERRAKREQRREQRQERGGRREQSEERREARKERG